MKTDWTCKRFMANRSDSSRSTSLMNRKSRQQKLCKHLYHYKWLSHLLVIHQKLTNLLLLSNHYLRTVNARYFNARICFKTCYPMSTLLYCPPKCVPLSAIHGLALPKFDPLEHRRQ
ncbi:hypothetical protein CDAR_529421 [Caerostris darwini]|uniref:Uncharacterized protein n=1 Tax=Caerostris darwini TaxID=1538125 RepID=A0AAV4WQG4_9ARAC|nr:hypothetical protein CDAR_529421 [Caerostris darwini]